MLLEGWPQCVCVTLVRASCKGGCRRSTLGLSLSLAHTCISMFELKIDRLVQAKGLHILRYRAPRWQQARASNDRRMTSII